MRVLLALTLVACLSGPALACINDAELVDHEREFKAQYEDSPYQPPVEEPVSASRPYVFFGSGALMAVAGVGLMLRFRNSNS